MFAENRGDTVLHFDLTQPSDSVEQKVVEHPHGSIGLATWNTVAEYKDVKVTSGDKVLFQSDFDKTADDWKPTRGSEWSLVDGAYRQSALGNDRRSFAGDTDWTDYTLTLKARKISGTEGFMIIFHAPNRNNLVRWNIGGWGNTSTALEQVQDGDATVFGNRAPISIKPDIWYNIRIELQGPNIKCYLDDKLITAGCRTCR